MKSLDLTANIIDVRDIIARVEELECEMEAYAEKMDDWQANADNEDDLATLTTILADLKGSDGDEQWRGDWYPVTLIRSSHFREYAQELAEDCGMVDPQAAWPLSCIDWEQASRELRMDYTSVLVDGSLYWYR